MTTTVLTDEQIDAILASPGDMRWVIATKKERYVLFARAIEQAVLQSAQVQAWKKDAERWSFARDILTIDDIETAVENMRGFTPDPDESAKADATIDAAMEKQP